MKYIYLILTILFIVISIFLFNTFVFYLYYRVIKKIKPIKKIGKPYKLKPLLYRLFIEFPKSWARDIINNNPNFFPLSGLVLVCGKQGSGKTVTTTYILQELQKKYPLMKIATNYNYTKQDKEINHWKDLIFYNNGPYGVTCVLDEISVWFSSLQSKDFPSEMLQEISQQRKQRKMILGTSQVFTRVAKPIREQTNYIICPMTLFGCLTICIVKEPILDDSANVKEFKFKKMFMFVHTNQLRDSYDTYKKIEKLSKDGFKSQSEQMQSDNSSNININIKKNKVKIS